MIAGKELKSEELIDVISVKYSVRNISHFPMTVFTNGVKFNAQGAYTR